LTNYVQGLYKPQNPEKYIGDINQIVYRSSWELRAFRWADTNSSILEWSSEPFPIKYFDHSTNKMRRYFPDLFLKIKDRSDIIKTYLIEIKPEKQTKPPKPRSRKTKTYLNEMTTYQKNISKWTQAEEFCKQNNMIFKLVTEKELGI
jgi:hypothetical protein